jgi:hypothetical protein
MMSTDDAQHQWETRNDEVACWLLGDNAAVGTARFLLLTLAYIVSTVLVLDGLLR